MARNIRATGAAQARVYAIDPHAGYRMAPDGLDTYAALLAAWPSTTQRISSR
jgi:hypothetical protein